MITDLLEEAAAERDLGLLDRERLPRLGVLLLENGVDAPAVIALAGAERASPDELDQLLTRAVAELDLDPPVQREAVARLARRAAIELVEHQVDAREATAYIWRLTRAWKGDPLPELDTFVYAASEWDERPEDAAVFTSGVLAAARELAAGHTGDRGEPAA